MILACLLAMATVLNAEPVPRPVAAATFARMKTSGNLKLDVFARKVVEAVRGSDWDGFAKLAGKTVTFETYEQSSAGQGSEADVLFDDTHAPTGNKVLSYTCKKLSVDTMRPPSSFALDEFSYFASLVDECVSGKSTAAQCQASMLRPDRAAKTPTIWGNVATNATWRIELSPIKDRWRVARLVIEYH